MPKPTTLYFAASLLSSLLGLLGACGENEPAEEGDYYPMAVGASWTYAETLINGDETTLFYEVTEKTTMTFDHDVGEREVFVLENTFPDPGASAERRIQYIADDGTRAIRLRHLIYDDSGDLTKQRDFVPGFLRFDRGRLTEGETWTEELDRYTDLKDGSEVSKEKVMYRYEVISRHETVTVPAGTFDCVLIRRTDILDSEIKEYYFAPEAGKVKEVTVDVKTEELSDYQVVAAD